MAVADQAELRFEFGENWSRFLATLNANRINEAVKSLQTMLGMDQLTGMTFLDVGSGSGLFSLAARQLGARVCSFDYDAHSVECTRELKRRFFPNDPDWVIDQGSALDRDYMQSLGQFEIVYSWGVLHHTGAMWQALENVLDRVAAGGRLAISLYNDQGGMSRIWRRVKKTYNRLPRPLRTPYAVAVMAPREGAYALRLLITGRFSLYVRSWTAYQADRGMSRWHDMVDWVGGYPFEVSKPEEVFAFCRDRGLQLEKLKTCGGGLGCNEYVFVKTKRAS